jgi:hypothetical protein
LPTIIKPALPQAETESLFKQNLLLKQQLDALILKAESLMLAANPSKLKRQILTIKKKLRQKSPVIANDFQN